MEKTKLRARLDREFDAWYEENIMGEPLSYESIVASKEFGAQSVFWVLFERLSGIIPLPALLKKMELKQLLTEIYEELK